MSTTSVGENCYNPAVENLSKGLVNLYQPSLSNVQKQLKDLNSKQNMLISCIHQENLSLAEVKYSTDIQDMFKKMTEYHGKLVNIKKDMRHLRDRSIKLKKRAVKLQQIKEKDDLIKDQAQLDIEREVELIGSRPSTS